MTGSAASIRPSSAISTPPMRIASWPTRAQWNKANPALGKFRDHEDLATAIRKAIRMPAEEPKVRNLFLNQRVSPHRLADQPRRVDGLRWRGRSCSEGEEVYLALDLSSVVDLTALMIGSVADPCRVVPYLLEAARASDRAFQPRLRIGIASLQRVGRCRPSASISPGKSINPEVIALFIAELTQRYKVKGMAYDRWRINDSCASSTASACRLTRTTRKAATACGWCHGAKASRIWGPPSMRWSWR